MMCIGVTCGVVLAVYVDSANFEISGSVSVVVALAANEAESRNNHNYSKEQCEKFFHGDPPKYFSAEKILPHNTILHKNLKKGKSFLKNS
jgi:hypothetical protein